MAEEKQTQGHKKMLLYIDDLIRNKNFIRLIKRIKKLSKKSSSPAGMYSDWTPEEQKEHDRINDEFATIIDGYESLRKKCKKLMRDKHFITREKIASEYGLDDGLIHLALEMYEKDDEGTKFYKDYSDPDMCKIVNIYEETMSPFNKGEELRTACMMKFSLK